MTVNVIDWTFELPVEERFKFNPFPVALAIGIHLKNVSLLTIILVDQVQKIYWNGRFPLNQRNLSFFTLLPHMHMRVFPSLPLAKVAQTCNIDE